MQQHQHHFEALYLNIDGFVLSKQARAVYDAPEYCYGEIVFMPFIALLSLCNINKNTIFYDLGSGTGKAVIACAMTFDIKQCIGIELFDALHEAASGTLNQLKQWPQYADKAERIIFHQADFYETQLHDADIVFINASAFFGEVWDQISQQCECMAENKQVITTSKPLHSEAFSIEKQTRVEMSWGVVTAYIHVKRHHNLPKLLP